MLKTDYPHLVASLRRALWLHLTRHTQASQKARNTLGQVESMWAMGYPKALLKASDGQITIITCEVKMNFDTFRMQRKTP